MLPKELIGASSIPIILSVLEKEDSYGYEIINKVKEISENKIEYKDGTLYPVLHKLEARKLIESYWMKMKNGRKRKYYRISNSGKKELIKEKENWLVMFDIAKRIWKLNYQKA